MRPVMTRRGHRTSCSLPDESWLRTALPNGARSYPPATVAPKQEAGSGPDKAPFTAPLRPSRDVVARRLDEETVLVHLRTNSIFALNRTGARLWELLEAGHDRAEIRKRMLAEFDVGEAELDHEIERILESLASERLLESEDERAAPRPHG